MVLISHRNEICKDVGIRSNELQLRK